MVAPNLIANQEVLELLLNIAAEFGIDKPYIVGGKVRDFIMKPGEPSDDVDLTTLSPECVRLGILLAAKTNETFRMFEDRHVRVFYSGSNLDFSSGVLSWQHPGVVDWLETNAPDKLEFAESFSRDFTINTMHQDIETGEVHDPTGLGLKDAESKIIRTPLPPEIAIKNDPRRIFRAIRLAAQFGMSIDDEISSYVKSNSEIILDPKLTTQYMTTEINKALEFNAENSIEHIFDMGLFKIIPLAGNYSKYLIKNKLLQKYLS